MLKIILYLGDKLLATFESNNEDISIGRNASNDIKIDNLAVSGRHAQVRKVLNSYLIEDLGSTNGTYVNDKKIERYELLDGDRVTIGKHCLEFSITSETKQSAAFDPDKTMILDTERQRELLDKNRGE